MNKSLKILIILTSFFLYNSCGIYKYTDQRKKPQSGIEKARKNIEEGRGIGIKGLIGKNNRSSEYEFSTSNSLWRASLELLDFLPLSTVDYSGGLIITDWYSDSRKASSESIKITVRFLSNEVRSNSLRIIVHQKICETNNVCQTNLIKSKIADELTRSILIKAASLEEESKQKK
jgi:hypothetical protein